MNDAQATAHLSLISSAAYDHLLCHIPLFTAADSMLQQSRVEHSVTILQKEINDAMPFNVSCVSIAVLAVLLCVVDQRPFCQQNAHSKNSLHLVQCAVPNECIWSDKWLVDDGRNLRSKGLDESHRGKFINESSCIHKTGTFFFLIFLN